MVIQAIFYGRDGASLYFKSVEFGFVTQSQIQIVKFSQVKNTILFKI